MNKTTTEVLKEKYNEVYSWTEEPKHPEGNTDFYFFVVFINDMVYTITERVNKKMNDLNFSISRNLFPTSINGSSILVTQTTDPMDEHDFLPIVKNLNDVIRLLEEKPTGYTGWLNKNHIRFLTPEDFKNNGRFNHFYK